MTRKPSNAQKSQTHRARPVLEGLEPRRLLSHHSVGGAIALVSSNGSFSHDDREFTYTTPTDGHAVINVIGRGNLTGTSLDSTGALILVYGGTNAFTKITGEVHGGDGRAPLSSILSSQLIGSSAQINGTGVGGTVLQAVLLGQFDLVAGGNINLAAGVNTLTLDSVGSDTQIHLRTLPPAPTSSTALTTSIPVVTTTQTGASSLLLVLRSLSTTTTTTSTENTLVAGQSTTVTTNGVSASYLSNGRQAQTLSSITGLFSAGTNLVESLPAGQPPQTQPPAPPGIILKVNSITGTTNNPINLLTDPDIFGYDPTTGQLVRFTLNLTSNTGTIDPSFPPISVPGHPTVAGLNLAWNGDQLDVLISSGTTVYAYNATTGAATGSFTTSVPINSIASSGTTVVLGSFQTNQLYAINLSSSLATGQAQPAGKAQPLEPAAGITLLGGLTGLPGSTTIFATVAATFDSFQPTQTQLGLASVSTAQVTNVRGHGTILSTELTAVSQAAIQQSGSNINVPSSPQPITSLPGPALGSVDQSVALVASASGGTNTINLYSAKTLTGTITLDYADPLAALSATFRPDLTASALIDITGNVQSIRGGSAMGMVLNDNGNLNLVKFASVANSTIVGQPLSHVQILSRSNDIILTPSRTVGSRNGVTVNQNLAPIGVLSQTND
jgi:hypothetical protein